MQSVGQFILLVGVLLAVLGLILVVVDRIPFLGKLPGDVHIKRENFQLYFPITTSAVLSLAITILLWLISHFKGR